MRIWFKHEFDVGPKRKVADADMIDHQYGPLCEQCSRDVPKGDEAYPVVDSNGVEHHCWVICLDCYTKSEKEGEK